jgi:hypothetical protein
MSTGSSERAAVRQQSGKHAYRTGSDVRMSSTIHAVIHKGRDIYVRHTNNSTHPCEQHSERGVFRRKCALTLLSHTVG